MLGLLNNTRSVKKMVHIDEIAKNSIYGKYILVSIPENSNIAIGDIKIIIREISKSMHVSNDKCEIRFLTRYFTAYQRKRIDLKELAKTCLIIYNTSTDEDEFLSHQNMRSVKKVNLFLLKAHESI